MGFLKTNQHNFFANKYFSVLPFTLKGDVVSKFKLTSERIPDKKNASRDELIIWAQRRNLARFKLWGSFNDGPWIVLAKIQLTKISEEDQEALCYSPIKDGLGIHPRGFIQHLRKGAYAISQLARPRHQLKKDKENASPSSPQFQGPWA